LLTCHVAEVKRREDFKTNMGDYLPSDIWPGLTDSPVRYEFTMAGDEERSLPQLDRDAIEGAMQRLEGRRRE
jgi:autophagy-related protein 17